MAESHDDEFLQAVKIYMLSYANGWETILPILVWLRIISIKSLLEVLKKLLSKNKSLSDCKERLRQQSD